MLNSPSLQAENWTIGRATGQANPEFLNSRVTKLDDPRSIGKSLQGSQFGELWRYRVGNYRLICKIEDDRLIVLVLRIGHRKEIYR